MTITKHKSVYISSIIHTATSETYKIHIYKRNSSTENSPLVCPIRKCVESGKLALVDGFLANTFHLGPVHLIQDGVVVPNEGGLGLESEAVLLIKTLDVPIACCRSLRVGKEDLAASVLCFVQCFVEEEIALAVLVAGGVSSDESRVGLVNVWPVVAAKG